MLKITLRRSTIGSPKTQRATVEALGLGRLHKTVLLPDNPQTRGMVRKVVHLVDVEEVEVTE
ncbi:MAG: 50S ribosomal protein L30 [Bacillota bacterium]